MFSRFTNTDTYKFSWFILTVEYYHTIRLCHNLLKDFFGGYIDDFQLFTPVRIAAKNIFCISPCINMRVFL